MAEDGPRRIWSELEALYRLYEQHDRPARNRYGVTITGTGQRVWLDQAAGPGWPLG